ncbi:hypothetical protein ASD39_02755 [Sphingomonas sp. Root50]|nr:hypothetical protein ASD17_01555 [Sphingomonas sp. Root1294]KQY69241.1 hypothetical protein ASD39_02755 [Sphingomonas sp. Root50]
MLLLLALLPIPFGGNRPWAWSAMVLWVSILLGGYALSTALGHQMLVWRRALTFPLVAICLLIAWILFTILPGTGFFHPVWQVASEAIGHPLPARMALSVDAALVGLMRLLAYMAIFWLSLQYCRDPKRADHMLVWISWTGFLIALYGLVNYFAGNPYLLWFDRFAAQTDVTATFVNRNHYATFAGMGLLCSFGLAVTSFRAAWLLSDRSQKRFSRTIECIIGRPLLYFVIMLVIGMAWLQAHSRMGTFSVLAGLAAMLLLMMATNLMRRRLAPWLFAALVLALLFFVSGHATLARLGSTSEIDRLPLFSVVVDQIASAPYTGSGYGSFAQSFAMYRDQRLPTAYTYLQAHNDYLELAADLGIPAAALLLSAIAWCAALCFVAVFRRQRGQIYPIVAVASTLTVALHALLDFSLQIPAVAALYSAILGMGVAQSWSAEPKRHERANGKRAISAHASARRDEPTREASASYDD